MTKPTKTIYTVTNTSQNLASGVMKSTTETSEAEALHSVTISNSAEKGKIKIEVKSYGYTTPEAGDAAEAEYRRLEAVMEPKS
jgi:hypothetical protein